MKYLVMECGTSYAVVLDESGKFLKVANMGYEVGQTVNHVVSAEKIIREDRSLLSRLYAYRRFIRFAASLVFAGFILFTANYYIFSQFGTVRIQINPDVLISVNRLGYVLDVSGLNEDGKAVAEDYGTFGKKLISATDDILSRADKLGYLIEGGKIELSADCEDNDWIMTTESKLSEIIDRYIADAGYSDITISIGNSKNDTAFGNDAVSDSNIIEKSNISADEALQIALSHFNLNESEVKVKKSKEKQGIYELELECGEFEYDCEIRKADGKIIKAEMEYDD